jgi:hypothetical protein
MFRTDHGLQVGGALRPQCNFFHNVMNRFVYMVIFLLVAGGAFAQPGTGMEPHKVSTLVDTMTVMPYLTASMNLFSGQAFLANASGPGIGGGISFDLTKVGQKVGFMFDFAFQDMYGVAQNGSCISSLVATAPVSPSADAYQYWDYLLFEPFIKIQTNSKRMGYFMIGASVGMAVQSETVLIAPGYPYEYEKWDDTPFGNRFRLDLRAGVGVELAKIGKHSLILEARAGYPLTNEISNYPNECTGGILGNWRIITIQGNLGLRL